MIILYCSLLCGEELEGVGQCERETSWGPLQGPRKGDDGDSEWTAAMQVAESG